MKMKSLAKNSAVNMMYTVLDFLSIILRSAYVARILMADGVGQVSYVQSIAGYFMVIADMGLSAYGIRKIAQAGGDAAEINKIFSELLAIHILSTTAALAAYFLAVPQIAGIQEQIPLFLAFGAGVFCEYFNVDWFYQGQEEYGYLAVRRMGVKLLSFGAMFVLVRTREDYMWYALVCCLETGCNYLFGMIHLRKMRVQLIRKGLNLSTHVRALLTLMLSLVFTTLYARVDVTMLGLLSTKAETGYYSYASTAINALSAACVAVLSIFLPRLSYCYREERGEFYRLLQLGIRIQIFLSIPVSVGVFLMASPMIELLFGSVFLPAAKTLRILAVLIVVKSFSNLVCYQLFIATENEKKEIPAFFAATILNVILNAFFIPVWGSNGAAMASVISEVFVCIYRTLQVHRQIRFALPWKALGQALAAAAIMRMAVAGISGLKLSVAGLCMAGIAGGAGVYGLVNVLMKNELVMEVFGMLKEWNRRKKGRAKE